MHAFQVHTADKAIAAMKANHSRLTAGESLPVEVSRARGARRQRGSGSQRRMRWNQCVGLRGRVVSKPFETRNGEGGGPVAEVLEPASRPNIGNVQEPNNMERELGLK